VKALALRLRPRFPRRARLGIVPQIVAVLLCLGVGGAMVLTPIRQLVEQRERIEAMSTELAQVQERNRALKERVAQLKNPDFLEQRAREQSGLVRPGEIGVVVMPPSRQAQKAKAEQRRKEEKPAPPPGYVERVLGFVGLR
jgi:cell division protein FtsB